MAISTLIWISAVITVAMCDWPAPKMACSYGERGSLTVYCINATTSYFKISTYRFDHLDETLKCINCNLSSLDQGTFDISGNKIKTLDIRNSSVKKIWPKAFLGLIFMEKLLLSDNPISNIYQGAFTGVRKVKYLGIENTGISTLEPFAFQELTLLDVLNLKNNKLSILDKNTFAGLKNLKILELSSNKLTDVGECFAPLTSLRMLDLQGNRIMKINGNEFTNSVGLIYLNLQSNDLVNFTLNIDPDNKLRVLNLARNRLTSDGMTLGTFKDLNRLETLDLSKNLLDTVSPKLLQGLYRLTHLDLYANQIKEFTSGSFSGLPHLRFLNISSNRLETARITGRLTLHSLHTLDLSNNYIEHFDYLSFVAAMPRITYVNLINNHIPCQTVVEIITLFQEDSMVFNIDDKAAEKCDRTSVSPKDIIQKLIDEKYKSSSKPSAAEIAWIVLICIIIILVAVLFYVQFFVLRRMTHGQPIIVV